MHHTLMGFEPTEAEWSMLSDQRSTSKPPRLGYGIHLFRFKMVGLPDFISHSKSRSFTTQPIFNLLNSRLVQISDPHSIRFKLPLCAFISCFQSLKTILRSSSFSMTPWKLTLLMANRSLHCLADSWCRSSSDSISLRRTSPWPAKRRDGLDAAERDPWKSDRFQDVSVNWFQVCKTFF